MGVPYVPLKTVNTSIGMFAFTLGLTSLKFDYSIQVAMVCFVVFLVWTFSEGKAYKRVIPILLPQNTHPIRYLSMIWKLKIFLFGMLFLGSVALSYVDNEG